MTVEIVLTLAAPFVGALVGYLVAARRRRAGEDAWRDLVAWNDRQLALEELRKRAR